LSSSKTTSVSNWSLLGQFFKLRLSFLVVFSALITYLIAAKGDINWSVFVFLLLGGTLITAASNGFNQIFEIETDVLMERTKNRPLPVGHMSVRQGYLLVFIVAVLGLFCLIQINELSFLLGLAAFMSYSLAYTPMKKHSRLAVYIGAVPGAIPTILGYVAYDGQWSIEAFLLFMLQFLWQFPHFWAIAWVLYDDYQKGGFDLLPVKGGRTSQNALWVLLSCVLLFPLCWGLFYMGLGTNIAFALNLCLSGLFALSAWVFYRNQSIGNAKKVMFASFIYLPLVLLSIWLV
jgi:heme o synthase